MGKRRVRVLGIIEGLIHDGRWRYLESDEIIPIMERLLSIAKPPVNVGEILHKAALRLGPVSVIQG